MPVNPAIFIGPGPIFTRNGKGEPLHTGKKYIVIHPAALPEQPGPVSCHYRALPSSLIQLLDTDWRAQHTGSKPGCDYGIAYTFNATPPWPHAPWDLPLWALLVEQVAADCTQHGITAQTLTRTQIAAGLMTGIVSEGQLAAAFEGTSGHTYLPLSPLCAAVQDLLMHGISPARRPCPHPAVRPAVPLAPPQDNPVPWTARLHAIFTRRKGAHRDHR